MLYPWFSPLVFFTVNDVLGLLDVTDMSHILIGLLSASHSFTSLPIIVLKYIKRHRGIFFPNLESLQPIDSLANFSTKVLSIKEIVMGCVKVRQHRSMGD